MAKGKGGRPQQMPGGGNMNNLIKQAQKMQEQMQRAQEELDESVFSSSSGGGMVEIEITGKRQITSLKIKPEIVDPDDVEMLEDMLTAAFNAALEEVEKAMAEKFKFAQAPGGGLGMF